MPKNFFQDMVKIKHTLSENLTKTSAEKAKKEIIKEEFRVKHHGVRALWFVALISVAFFVFALSILFTKAEITVSPKVKDLVLNENLSAIKNTNNDLPFDLVIISGQEDKTVQATLEKEISQKATGVVVIYNAFSSVTQRLDIDTRLEGSNGKIYKTEKTVTVPGIKGSTPGSIEVNIFGADAGEAYNNAPLDFKIFGFKGTPKYSKFYARSKGEINGGLKGKFPTISEAQKVSLKDELKTTLQAKLFKKAADQIPSGFILFKDAIFFNVDNENLGSPDKDKNLLITLKGTLYGVLFEEKKLTEKIIKNSIEGYNDSDVYISNIKNLVFLPSQTNSSNFGDSKNISFNLSGPAKVVWKVDENKLASDLLGKSKKNFNQILSQYPNIDSAESTISPFWKLSFPDKIEKIKVAVSYPE